MRILMLYIEPAPYILDLIRVTRERNPDIQLRVYFTTAALTQDWGSQLDNVAILLPVNSWSALRVLVSDIVQGEFDVLHLAGWGNPLMLCSLIVGGLFRRKITIESDTQLPIGLAFWKRAIKRVLYPAIFLMVDIAFPGGSRQKQYFLHYGVPEHKIRIAQMTVDVSRIIECVQDFRVDSKDRRVKLGIPEDAVVFVFVGRLEEYKGITNLVSAFKSLSNKQQNAYLLVVGDGSCRLEIEDAAINNSRICYVGRKNYLGVLESYSVADVCIVPSLFEPWGLVVNEAMAAGLPVIVSDRVGCAEDLVLDGQTGFIVSAGNVNQLAGAMERLAKSAELRRRMGETGRERISGWKLEDEGDILSREWRCFKRETDYEPE